MTSRAQKDLATRRANFMDLETPGEDRFARAAKIQEQMPSGTAPRVPQIHTRPVAEGGQAVSESLTLTAKLADVIENPLNARHSYKEKRITDLAASIAQRGQLTPAIACLTSELMPLLEGEEAQGLRKAIEAAPNAGAPYLLIGGHYRKKALGRLDKPIELKVVTLRSLLDLYALSYAENDEREDTTPLDDALSWQNLLELGIAKTQEDISRATNKTRSTIVKTLALLKLPQEVQDIFKEAQDRYSYLAAYTLTQLVQHVTRDKLIAFAEQIVTSAITTRELEAVLAAATAETPARKVKEISRQHKLHSEGQEIGVIKEWDNGRVLLDIRLPDGMTREALVAEMRKRFGGDADTQLPLR
jgi:ParB family transcriptional regulator, chromosome partitioning protein